MKHYENCKCDEFSVSAGGRTVAATIISPDDEAIARNPGLLLTFAMDRHTSLFEEPYCIAAGEFLKNGHRVVSFDLPNHGDRINSYGSHIQGLRNAFIGGCDPFRAFLEDSSAVIGRCVDIGLTKPGRICACGTSRGGYFALRLLAEDDRVAAGAGFAPVTDWRYLDEFFCDRDRDDVKGLRLSSHINPLAGKKVFIAIGSHDSRVSTASCCRFCSELMEYDASCGYDDSLVDFYCTTDAGHSCSDYWYIRSAQFMLGSINTL